ncbi:MAG: SIR2 family protein [Gammaproteobacteria bacterium]
MNELIKRSIERGRLVLLFGSGASVDCLDSNHQQVLSSGELAVFLAAEAGQSYNGESLPIVYAAAKRRLGNQLPTLLESKFRHCKPSPAYATIARYPWARIYSLNIDDAFDSALRSNSPQRANVRYRNDPVVDQDQVYKHLDFVKLNGSIDRLADGFVFSPREYGSGSSRPPLWYQAVAQDFFRYTFLFIGTKLNEPLFYHQIERYGCRSQIDVNVPARQGKQQRWPVP